MISCSVSSADAHPIHCRQYMRLTKPYSNRINISWGLVNYIVRYWYHVVYRLSCDMVAVFHFALFYGKKLSLGRTLLELIWSTISKTRVVTVMVTNVMVTVMVRMVTVDLNNDIMLYMYAEVAVTNNCWPRLG